MTYSEYHSYNVDFAKEHGIIEAVLYQNIEYWIIKNEANEKNIYDGYCWTYNSVRAFQELFPEFSVKQIRTALDKLITKGILLKGNYNDKNYDRTAWYAIKSRLICPTSKNHLPNKANQFAQEGEPIPDINTDINHINNTTRDDLSFVSNDNRETIFKRPNIDDIRLYMRELSIYSDAEPARFFDYYESNGWMVGKHKMKDWKAAVRNWKRNLEKFGKTEFTPQPTDIDQNRPQPQELTPSEKLELRRKQIKESEGKNG